MGSTILFGVGLFSFAVLCIAGWIVYSMYRDGVKAQAEHEAWLRERAGTKRETLARLASLTDTKPKG